MSFVTIESNRAAVYRSMRLPFVLACSALLIAAPAAAAELARYTVTLDPELTTVTVEVTAARAVRALSSASPMAASRLVADQLQGTTLVDGVLRLQSSSSASRTRYSADIRPLTTRRGLLDRVTDAPLAISDPRLWLWLPEGFAVDDSVRIEFVLPPGIGVATPWQASGKGAPAAFVLGPQMLEEQGLVAFGTLAQRELNAGGATLRLSIASTDAAEVARFSTWAEGAWRSARDAVAAPPGSIEQLLVVPVHTAREAVPWGEVRRGTGNSVLALVQRVPDPVELREDWTLYHELSHLYLPYLGGNRWLAEGLASYYQNVLRARAGVLTSEVAWQRLAEGLARGAQGAKADQTVEEGGRMVTYWTGAALALEWDLALRQASNGAESLDSVLAHFAARHLPAHETWDAQQAAAALDAYAPNALGKDYFSRTVARTLEQRGFPDYLASFTRAGIDPATGRARLDAPPALAGLMRPRP